MRWPAFFWPHEVRIRNVASSGGLGGQYGQPFTVACEVKDEQQLVRNREGAEVVSSTNVTVPIDTTVGLDSLVTVWPGVDGAEREASVVRISRRPELAPLESHIIIYLA